MMKSIICILILVILWGLYRLNFFSRSRPIYFVLLLFVIIIIASRLACVSLKCLKYFPDYVLEKYFGGINLLPKNCNECIPDWNIREGIDESALILFGIFIFFITLFVKGIRISELIDRISKITIPGLEVDLLEKKLQNYENDNFQLIESEVTKEYVKTQRQIISNSSSDEERLLLLNAKIEDILKEIYMKSIGDKNEFIPASIKEVTSQLKKNKIIDEKLSNLLIDFDNVKVINATKLNGKKTLGLIEIGGRILKILLSLIKRFFKMSKIFYGKTEKLTIDRLKIESVKENEIVVCATINTIDSNQNYFPIGDLKSENVVIREKIDKIENVANVKNIISFGDSCVNLNIILLIDCSRSMKGDKLEKSKDAAIQLINDLSKFKTITCQVIVYKVTDQQGGYIDDKWFDINDHTLLNKIRELQADGGTPLWDSIEETINLACDSSVVGYKMIVCLTDGKNEVRGKNTGEQKSQFNKLRDRITTTNIPLFSIGFGNEDYKEMIELSMLSGAGKRGIGYFIGVFPKDLKGIFDDIIFSITKSYRIFWKPTFDTQDKDIDVDLEVSFVTKKGDMKKDRYRFKYKI